MAGSTFGKNFKITTFGESHGAAVGVIIDGCPALLELKEEDFYPLLNERRGNDNDFTTKRKEKDEIKILSGVYNNKTLGTPIAIIVENKAQESKDYEDLKDIYRPSHADITYDEKFGIRDYRGGGRSSGRETLARVLGGTVALKILNELGVKIDCYVSAIGGIESENSTLSPKQLELLEKTAKENDSIGGEVTCKITGLPVGIGEPVFEKLDATLSEALMSIGGVKAIEFGAGVNVSKEKGSKNNDSFVIVNDSIKKSSNNAGGILGGISDSDEIIIKLHIKPTPSIALTQDTVSSSMEEVKVNIKGRHDTCIALRIPPVAKSMCALTLVDYMFINMSSRLDKIKDFYQK